VLDCRSDGDTRAEGAVDRDQAALAEALGLVGDRWSLQVIQALLAGPARFGRLERRIGGIAPNVLTERLKRLQAAGVVVAEPYQERPPRFAYGLTERGRELGDVLRLLAAWAVDGPDRPRHTACDTPLATRWWCPTCDIAVDDPAGELIWI
jgi:DNA-binding HxlR family transcriptional regulator